MTQGRSIRYALAFSMLGTTSFGFGALAGYAGVPLLWFGATLLTVGANYAFPKHCNVLDKKDGRIGLVRKLFLLPYFILLHGTWRILNVFSSEAPYVKLVDGIFIGRRLLPNEYPTTTTLVDLTSEFDEHVPKGAILMSFPILDGAPTEPSTLRHIAREISLASKPIYIHCAQGHGRTSMVAAAVLLELGVARNVADALQMIRLVRPGAKPNASQREALIAAFPDVGFGA
jgi:Tyrosine phosphatase family